MSIEDQVVPIILHYAKQRGIGQNKLAEMAGVSKGCLSDLKNGKRPWTLKSIAKLTTALDLKINFEVKGSDHE